MSVRLSEPTWREVWARCCINPKLNCYKLPPCSDGSEDNQVMRGSSEAALAVLISALSSFSSGDGSSGFLFGLRAGKAFSWEEDTALVHFCLGIQLSFSWQTLVPHPSCGRLSFPVGRWTQQQDLHSLTLPFLLKCPRGVNKPSSLFRLVPNPTPMKTRGLLVAI